MRHYSGLVLSSSSASRQDVVTKLAEKAERASRKWDATCSGFLDRATWNECER